MILALVGTSLCITIYFTPTYCVILLNFAQKLKTIPSTHSPSDLFFNASGGQDLFDLRDHKDKYMAI